MNKSTFKYQSILAVLLTDFYKQCHAEQYDERITKLVAYYTPRVSRLEGIDFVPVLGIQAFIKEYLIEYFNTNFFEVPLEEVIFNYEEVIVETMGPNRLFIDKIIKLHGLGYLPLEIRALDEGTKCPIKVPMIEISNTHDEFAWVTNLIESLMSAELWYHGCAATSGILYRNIVNKYYDITSDNPQLKKSAIAEFGMRGLIGVEGAEKASMGFLLSFNKTATIPSIWNIREFYGDKLKSIATGMASTEHSVMCSSYSLDGDEKTLIKRLLTKEYPEGNLSMVCDSYDYWNIVENILPKFKEEILKRNGTLYVRGDSGNPVDITVETVQKLWKHFGGSFNSKGYMVLDPHIRVIYGDSITPGRAKQIYSILENMNFSAENVVLGAGSFSMLCLEEEYEVCSPAGSEKQIFATRLAPYTRDTFGVAIKTTYGEYKTKVPTEHCMIQKEVKNGFNIFKNPKTDSDNFKKSQKGCCVVIDTERDGIICVDEVHFETRYMTSNLLTPVFKDGILLKETTFNEVRNRLWNNEF